MNQRALARGHGWSNIIGGAWPLLHMPSFEAVLGPKTDRWLVRTVAGLLVVNGAVQVNASSSAATLPVARRLGIGTALTLGTIDLVYAVPGRISRMYLVDAALEAAWILAWLLAGAREPLDPDVASVPGRPS